MKKIKPKKYQIKTVQDMFNCVTKKNLDNFMIDLRSLIETYIAFKELVKIVGEVEGLPPELAEISSDGYTWVDDGKHEKTVKISSK